MKDFFDAIVTIVAMVIGFLVWLIVFAFNLVAAVVAGIGLIIAFPFVWIYGRFIK